MWTLIVLIAGALPPQGMVLHGFATREECLSEATLYCWPPPPRKYSAWQDNKFICKCEWGLNPEEK
jgi:hypothetical protein